MYHAVIGSINDRYLAFTLQELQLAKFSVKA